MVDLDGSDLAAFVTELAQVIIALQYPGAQCFPFRRRGPAAAPRATVAGLVAIVAVGAAVVHELAAVVAAANLRRSYIFRPAHCWGRPVPRYTS